MAQGTSNWPSHWYGPGVWNLPDPNYPCKKEKFQTKQDAKLAIKRIRSEMANWRRKEGKPSPFRCNNCGLWHWGHKREGRDDERIYGRSGSGDEAATP